jgi:hypothetical protein
MPERVSSNADASSATLAPIGDTTPIPVMTTACRVPIVASRLADICRARRGASTDAAHRNQAGQLPYRFRAIGRQSLLERNTF